MRPLLLLTALSAPLYSAPAFAFQLLVSEGTAEDGGDALPSQTIKRYPGMQVSFIADIYDAGGGGGALQGLNRRASEFQWKASCDPIENQPCESGTFQAGNRMVSMSLPQNMGRSITLTITHTKKQSGDPATSPATVIILNAQAPEKSNKPQDSNLPGGEFNADGSPEFENSSSPGDPEGSSSGNGSNGKGASYGMGSGGGGFGDSDGGDWSGWGSGRGRGRGDYGGGSYGSSSKGNSMYGVRENPEPVYCISFAGRNGRNSIHCQEISSKRDLRVMRQARDMRETLISPEKKEVVAKAKKRAPKMKTKKLKVVKKPAKKAKALASQERTKKKR